MKERVHTLKNQWDRCIEAFKYDTLIPLDENFRREIKQERSWKAARRSVICYMEAMRSGNEEIVKYLQDEFEKVNTVLQSENKPIISLDKYVNVAQFQNVLTEGKTKTTFESGKKIISKKKTVVKEQIYYFGPKRVRKLYETVPEVIEVPKKTNIVLSNAFYNLVGSRMINIQKIILSEQVREIQKHAFKGLVIQETIVIPDSVTEIGEDAFQLSENAYVTCSIGSKAYSYCKQHKLKNTVDIAIWRKYGRCQHCGGSFFPLLKKCKNCGCMKDY